MTQIAKVFMNGRSQAVRLPQDFRFEEDEVYVRRDPETGDVILSRRPDSWNDFFALDKTTDVPEDFMTEADRNQPESSNDPFSDNEN
ncbi:TPA: antitoxin [Klebsiella pneumoniae]